jgi:hypothetical protein
MMPETNGEGNNDNRDNWETPKWLFDLLIDQYNFEFDCCAKKDNTKCYNYSSNFETIEPIEIVAWMNPPFSKAYKMFEHFFKVVSKGVSIYRSDNLETSVWQKIILPNASWIFFFDRRINYEGSVGKGARFPSALIGIGLPTPKMLKGMPIKKL